MGSVVSSHRGSNILRMLSAKFAEGGVAARVCTYVLKRFGCEGGLLARLAEFMDLISTCIRHAGLTLKSATDILTKIYDSQAPHIPQENVTPERNEVASEEMIETAVDNDS